MTSGSERGQVLDNLIEKVYVLKMALVMYVKPGCPYCQQARDYFTSKSIDFVEYDAQNDKSRQKEMLEFSSGDVTVPCIVENGVYLRSGWGEPPRG
jgi:glutaredoxin 3